MFARACALMVPLFFLSSCVVSSALDAMKDEAAGRVELTGPAGGLVELRPVRCASGERELFLGADFTSTSGATARIIVDPHGTATLRFFEREDRLTQGLVFTRAECETFHLDLHRTGWRVNKVYDLSVRAEFSCLRASDGAAARGTLSAAHCH